MQKYIIIEWIHWSWKSSVAQEVANQLQQQWINAQYYHFPDEEDDLGKVIRKIVADKNLAYQREITGLLYASFANIFHTKTKTDDKVYILDRHSVTTWLVFQSQMSRNTRLEIYKPWIQALLENGQIFYLQIDKDIARQRSEQRNNEIIAQNTKHSQDTQNNVWINKAKDVFNEEKFDELTNLYETNLITQIQKLWLDCDIVDNNGSIQQSVDQIIKKLK